MRDVMVGFLTLRAASPFTYAPLAGTGFAFGGRAKFASGWDCTEDAVEAEGTGEATGFAVAEVGLLVVGAAMVEMLVEVGESLVKDLLGRMLGERRRCLAG